MKPISFFLLSRKEFLSRLYGYMIEMFYNQIIPLLALWGYFFSGNKVLLGIMIIPLIFNARLENG